MMISLSNLMTEVKVIENYCCHSVAVSNTFAKTLKTTFTTLSYLTGGKPFSAKSVISKFYMKVINKLKAQ